MVKMWLAIVVPLTLSWNPNTETNLAGYNLHWGTNSGRYVQHQAMGLLTASALTTECPCYFSLTASNTLGQQSDYSIEASYIPYVAPPPPIQPLVIMDWWTNKSPVIHWAVQAGFCDTLQSSSNLVVWQNINRVFYTTNNGQILVSLSRLGNRLFRVRRGTCP